MERRDTARYVGTRAEGKRGRTEASCLQAVFGWMLLWRTWGQIEKVCDGSAGADRLSSLAGSSGQSDDSTRVCMNVRRFSPLPVLRQGFLLKLM